MLNKRELKIIAISDTHNKHKEITIPECDILIHAGDATGMGRASEIRNFAKWFNKQPAKYKIFVPGNHELKFEKELPASKLWFSEECPDGILLINQSIEIEGIKIYGSPITPFFYNWAWNEYKEGLEKAWKAIPDDTNLLITHGQAYGINDIVDNQPGVHLGCQHLMDRIQELKNLKIYIGGHLHSGKKYTYFNGVQFYNASICGERYTVDYAPTEITID